jgi:serine/threonine protein kinase
MSLTQQHLSTPPAPFTQPIPEPIKRLIMALLSKDPYLRPSSAELVLSCLSTPEEEASHHIEQTALTHEPQEHSEPLESTKSVESLTEPESTHNGLEVTEFEAPQDHQQQQQPQQQQQQQQQQRLALIALSLLSAPLAVLISQWL